MVGGHFLTEDPAVFDGNFFNLSQEAAAVSVCKPWYPGVVLLTCVRVWIPSIGCSWRPHTRRSKAVS